MSKNTSKTIKNILNVMVQRSIAREANKTVSCPTIWSYQPHRPTTPLFKASDTDFSRQKKD